MPRHEKSPGVSAEARGQTPHEDTVIVARMGREVKGGGPLNDRKEALLRSEAHAEPEKPQYWAVLPSVVRYDETITAGAKLLYAEISSLTDRLGFCYASNAYFQRLYGISEPTVQRYLRALKAGGYIAISDGDGGQGRRKIYAGVNPLVANPVKNDGVTPSKMTPNPVKNDTHIRKENRKENDPPKAPQGAGADYTPKEAPDWKPDRFARFWEYYPLHKSKQAAIRAWDKLKPSNELLAVIGVALRRQKAEKLMAGEEWKLYASTYLNQARWTDEPGAAQAGPPRPSGEEAEIWLN